MADEKAQFRNQSDGHVGVVVFNEKREREGADLPPGERVWLSIAEQEATASAPRLAENNPFVGLGPNGGPALVMETEARLIPGTTRPIGSPSDSGPSDEGEKSEAGENTGEDPGESPKPTRRRKPKRQSEETGAAAEPAGDPPEGEYGVGEEVGTPEAAEK